MTTERKLAYILVDDHSFFRDGVRNYLNLNSPFECIGEFSQTRPLINAGTNMQPDFILLDLNLPGLGGEISCSRLKDKFPRCKIIALTQYTNLRENLLKMDFDGYIEKNNSDDLLNAIEIVLAGKPYFPENPGTVGSKFQPGSQSGSFPQRNEPSARELEIMEYVAEEYTNPEIAKKLFISEFTVKTHRKNFSQKTGIKKRKALIEYLESKGRKVNT